MHLHAKAAQFDCVLGIPALDDGNHQIDKGLLPRTLGGIRDMGGIPDIMFVIDANKEELAIKEANRLGIPVVAVVDTGIDFTHPDLQSNLWSDPKNPSVHGYTCSGGSCVAGGQDNHGHGTHVAGIIGAVGNNATGIAGAIESLIIFARTLWTNVITAIAGMVTALQTGGVTALAQYVQGLVAAGVLVLAFKR